LLIHGHPRGGKIVVNALDFFEDESFYYEMNKENRKNKEKEKECHKLDKVAPVVWQFIDVKKKHNNNGQYQTQSE
jgi:hypothetical protein